MDTWADERLSICRGVKRSNPTVLLAAAFIILTITGCGTLQNGRGWGQDAIYPLELKRISHAAYHAFFDLQTLLPVAGALVFTLGNFDQRASEWATTTSPIFGDGDSTTQFRDYITFGLGAESFLTALAAPSNKDLKDWASNKAKGIGVGLGVALATEGVTYYLKENINRVRPNGGHNSFPSGHASNAFSSATLANRNLNSIKMPEKVRIPLQAGNIVLATAVSWQRVEAGAHYPSDVLAGAAIGHFLSTFFYDAFMGIPEHRRWGLFVSSTKGGAMIGLSFGF